MQPNPQQQPEALKEFDDWIPGRDGWLFRDMKTGFWIGMSPAEGRPIFKFTAEEVYARLRGEEASAPAPVEIEEEKPLPRAKLWIVDNPPPSIPPMPADAHAAADCVFHLFRHRPVGERISRDEISEYFCQWSGRESAHAVHSALYNMREKNGESEEGGNFVWLTPKGQALADDPNYRHKGRPGYFQANPVPPGQKRSKKKPAKKAAEKSQVRPTTRLTARERITQAVTSLFVDPKGNELIDLTFDEINKATHLVLKDINPGTFRCNLTWMADQGYILRKGHPGYFLYRLGERGYQALEETGRVRIGRNKWVHKD